MQNLSKCDCECNKGCKTDRYLGIKKQFIQNRIFSKLILAYEGETSNTTKTSLNDKKVELSYSHDFIDNYILIISCHFYQLLLQLYKISIIKKKHLLPHDETSNKLKGIDISNTI